MSHRNDRRRTFDYLKSVGNIDVSERAVSCHDTIFVCNDYRRHRHVLKYTTFQLKVHIYAQYN